MLKRSDEQGVTPRIVATNTSWEYWRGDASLLRIDPLGPDGPRDLPEHPLVRHYHLSGTQHGSGALPQTDTFEIGEERGGHGFNVVDYSPLTRAALVHLDRWIADGTEPPPSAHPRIADGTAVSRAEVLEHFASARAGHARPRATLPSPHHRPRPRRSQGRRPLPLLRGC